MLATMVRRMAHYAWHRPITKTADEGRVGLGQVSLESGAGASSFCSADDSVVVFLDGEIYDSAAARARLRGAGATFEGDSQAEVLWRACELEGGGALATLHGLFTAAAWDAARRELIVVTDRFGMRPVYVASGNGFFIAASEIKAVLAEPGVDRTLSQTGLAQFFSFGYFLNEDTLLQGVRAVPPATCLRYSVDDRRIAERRYWRAQPSRTSSAAGADAVRAVEDTLVAAVARRAGPGERVGLSLSAGLDARTILALVPEGRNLQTLSIGIEGSIDHRGSAELARLAGVSHRAFVLDETFLGNFERHFRDMVRLTDGHYLDQGIVMPTLPAYREMGVDYLLRGHAGELLHMRKAYAYSLDDEALASTSPDAMSDWLHRHLTAYMLQQVPRDLFLQDIAEPARASLTEALDRLEPAGRPVDVVWPLFLTERLHRETALSMHKFACFAAVRLPYLDNDFVDAVLALPAEARLGDEVQAAILQHRRPAFLGVVNSNTGARLGAGALETQYYRWQRRILAKLGVKGYQPYERLGLWIRRELRPWIERTLDDDECHERGLFRPDAVRQMLARHMTGQANHTFLIMSLMAFELGQRLLEDPEGFAERFDRPRT